MAKLSRRKITSQERKKLEDNIRNAILKAQKHKVSEPDPRQVDDINFDKELNNGVNVPRRIRRVFTTAKAVRKSAISKKGKS